MNTEGKAKAHELLHLHFTFCYYIEINVHFGVHPFACLFFVLGLDIISAGMNNFSVFCKISGMLVTTMTYCDLPQLLLRSVKVIKDTIETNPLKIFPTCKQ